MGGGYQRSSESCPALEYWVYILNFVQTPKGPTTGNTCCSTMDIFIKDRLRYEHLSIPKAHPLNAHIFATSLFALNLLIVPCRFTMLIAIYPRAYKVVRMINEGIYIQVPPEAGSYE